MLGKLVITIMSVVLLSSCAFTNDQVKIDFDSPHYTNVTPTNVSIKVNTLNDSRGVDPKLISYKGVQTKTGGQYINDIEISKLMTTVVSNTLVNMGYELNSAGNDLIFSGEVMKFDSYVVMGFWSGSVEAAIQLNLKVVNSNNGNIIWSEIMSGHGKKKGAQVDHWGHRKVAFDVALDNLIHNISSSETLKEAIARYQS
ncbi:MAG: hypothetical protein JRG71_04375 [Deltaproteobacteria bacterium]|nr:hypothetical protein [Deltaproteobacteria bacterium]